MSNLPGNSETIYGHQQQRKQRHGHKKAQISCDPLGFQISDKKKGKEANILVSYEKTSEVHIWQSTSSTFGLAYVKESEIKYNLEESKI